jgi:RNA polymerase sigma factor (sigma-70 family)
MATVAPQIPVLARDEAFEQLYRRYVKDVYHYALALLRNPADAEDVTQTTFLNAYRAYQRGDEIHKPQHWLIKIAHNVARSRYARSTRRVKEVPLEDHVEHLALPQDDQPNVEGILRALGRLPFNQRAALIMRELEGRSYSEIADTLGVSVSAVETLIFRARRSLRVRTTALRSILTVPVPSSLTQFVGGSGAGAAGGAGAGLLMKAAVALVAGGLATGLGVEGSRRAAASPDHRTARVATVERATTLHRHAVRAPHATRRAGADARARGRGGRTTTVAPSATDQPTSVAAAAVPASGPSAAPTSTQAATPLLPFPVESVTSAAAGTVQSTLGTVDQVADSLPVTVPQLPPVPPLPVQTPPPPKLP